MTTDRKQTKYRNRRREPQDAHDRSLTASMWKCLYSVTINPAFAFANAFYGQFMD